MILVLTTLFWAQSLVIELSDALSRPNFSDYAINPDPPL